jgi:hypothetical protein
VLYTVLQGVSLRFEAEATGWLQNKNIPMTNDAAKYENKDVTAKVLAILTPGGLHCHVGVLNCHVAGVHVLVAHWSYFMAQSCVACGVLTPTDSVANMRPAVAPAAIEFAALATWCWGVAADHAVVACLACAGSTFVDSLEAAVQAANGDADGVPVGLVLDSTSFYAESGGQVRPISDLSGSVM